MELLLQGKCKIDLSQKIDFRFVNVGNLLQKFENLSAKIHS